MYIHIRIHTHLSMCMYIYIHIHLQIHICRIYLYIYMILDNVCNMPKPGTPLTPKPKPPTCIHPQQYQI